LQKNARLKPKGVDGGPELKYRDRAAERRTLHKGFGIGPGQKVVSIHELEKEEAEAATEMPAALKKAASARPIGRDNIGKRMLEGMGWKEVSFVYYNTYSSSGTTTDSGTEFVNQSIPIILF
jgi:hypothetical protein